MIRKILVFITAFALISEIAMWSIQDVFASEDKFIIVSSGYNHTMAIKADYSLWAWGNNEHGKLGDGTTTRSPFPIKVMDEVESVSAGGSHTLAIKTDGSLWAWGDNKYGQLGDGTTTSSSDPKKIMDEVTSVSTFMDYTMAVKTDGTLWAWGFNADGQLGDGTTANRLTPVNVMDDVASVSAGWYHTTAIKIDGSLWAWGKNEVGQLGDGTKKSCVSPKKIMSEVAFVSTGTAQTMAIKTDASLWAWGDNGYGSSGYTWGDNESKESARSSSGDSGIYIFPTKIMDNVASASSGGGQTMAIKIDGSLWAWGLNSYGKVGDGTKTDRRIPVKIMDGAISVSAGVRHTTAVKTDGSLWTWGDNTYGQLGDGTITEHHVPMAVENKEIQPFEIYNAPFTAHPTLSNVYVNGVQTHFEAYNINGSNYFKLRDIAKAINGTNKQFEVKYDNTTKTVILTSGKTYTAVGGELIKSADNAKTYMANNMVLYKDDKKIEMTSYLIDGNNFLKLRDIMKLFDISVTYDAVTRNISIDTSIGYSE